MAENNKLGCLSWLGILIILGLIGEGVEKCSTTSSDMGRMSRQERKEHKIAFAAYEKIMQYCFDNCSEENFGSSTGYVSGDARFKYDFSDRTITVTYTALQYQASEIGHLSKFTIAESCGLKNSADYYPVSIQGRWQPEGSGGGDLIVTLSRKNVLKVFIFGDGDWKHWAEYQLPTSEDVWTIFNEARQKVAELKK